MVTLSDIIYLTQDELRRLFAVIKGKRDKALFLLAYHHGLRVSEVSPADPGRSTTRLENDSG